MTIIDTIQADQIEIGDTISVDGDEFEVKGIIDSHDVHAVTISGHNLTTGLTETHELPFDYSVSLLGY